jgi:hypothetical protein
MRRDSTAPGGSRTVDDVSLIERDQDDCTCDPPESPTPLGAALCPLHGWDALRRQVVRLSLQHQGAVSLADVCEFLRSATYPDPATGGDRHPHGYKAAAADLERHFGGQ